mmetsp:Transcript_37896/g.74938  ORF Transcript_37896/g.74938 Transcript_37896/m.74938 type:complete len:80 (+) Transcript_37896:252-491(+)
MCLSLRPVYRTHFCSSIFLKFLIADILGRRVGGVDDAFGDALGDALGDVLGDAAGDKITVSSVMDWHRLEETLELLKVC